MSKDPLGTIDGPNLFAAYFVPIGSDPSGLDWWWPGKCVGRFIGECIGKCVYPTSLPPPGPCGKGELDEHTRKIFELCLITCERLPHDPFGLFLCGDLDGIIGFICRRLVGVVGVPDCHTICCDGVLEHLPGDECFNVIYTADGPMRKQPDPCFRACQACCMEHYPDHNSKAGHICETRCTSWCS